MLNMITQEHVFTRGWYAQRALPKLKLPLCDIPTFSNI